MATLNVKTTTDFALQEFPITFREYCEFLNAWLGADPEEANRRVPRFGDTPLCVLTPRGYVPIRELIGPEVRALGRPGYEMEYDVPVFGINFDDGDWMISALDTWTRNHEFVLSDAATVAYDTLGAELLVGYRFGGVLMPYGGIDFAIPRDLDTRFVDPDYGTRDVLGGIRWLFDPKPGSFVYLEGRTGQTRDVTGVRAEDVVTLGIRFNYSLRGALGLP